MLAEIKNFALGEWLEKCHHSSTPTNILALLGSVRVIFTPVNVPIKETLDNFLWDMSLEKEREICYL